MWGWPQSFGHKSHSVDVKNPFKIRGDGYAKNSFKIESQQLSLGKHRPATASSKTEDDPAVSTECDCHKSFINLNSFNGEIKLAERLWNSEALGNKSETEENDLVHDEEEDTALDLSSLLSTLVQFSTRHLSLYQISSIARLARSIKRTETITKDQAQTLQALLECDGSPVQAAALIVLAKLVSVPETLEFFFRQQNAVIDCLFNLASDSQSNEVKMLALKAIEQISKHQKLIASWEKQLEDIVYPLVLCLIKSSNSAEGMKLTCLNILQNVSQLPYFFARVKQDVLSLLNQTQNDYFLKGMYIEILHTILETFKQKISTDVLETCLLPILAAMITKQKCKIQCQGLKLLTFLSHDSSTRTVLLGHPQTIAVCIYLNEHSQCRKVIAGTCLLIQEMLNTKNSLEAKQFLTCLSESMAINCDYEQLKSNRIRGAPLNLAGNKTLRCSDCQLWTYLDEFVDRLVLLLENFGCLEKHENSFTCELSKLGSINSDQVTIITSLISCFTNLCSWPVHRPKYHRDFMFINDQIFTNEDLRIQLKCLKHKHAFFVWEKVGLQAMALCRHFAFRLSSTHNITGDDPLADRCSTDLNISVIRPTGLEENEIRKSLLNFLLCMSVASCFCVIPAVQENSLSTKPSEKNRKKRLRERLEEKEAFAEKKLLRRQLVDDGLFYVIGQFIQMDDIYFKITSTAILRLCLQPTEDKPGKEFFKQRLPSLSTVQSPQSSLFLDPKSLSVNKVRHKQRPHSSLPYVSQSEVHNTSTDLVQREAIVLDSRRYSLFNPLTPRAQKKPIHEKNYYGESRIHMSKNTHEISAYFPGKETDHHQTKANQMMIKDKESDPMIYLTSPLEAGLDIIPQCCNRTIRSSAVDVLKGMFSPNHELKKSCLLLLLDLVKNGENSLHMELSKLGCVPKLISFLRIHDNDYSLLITGLTVTRLLLASDKRICQLFNFHGGSHLLMALLQNKPPEDLKDAIVRTLSSLNFMLHADQSDDPSSGPVDIWGHIMQRWKDEDKVVDVLKQFL